MKKTTTLFEDGDHRWIVVARDPERPDHLIDTNEYLITSAGEGLLTDPGGMEIFPAVFSAISAVFDPEKIRTLFASHQDPDIISSLALWLDFNPSLHCYLSWLWDSFVPHFGGNEDTFRPIPDEGMAIPLGELTLQAVPAHYLHSSGNFHLYDGKARILFSGDIGAAMIPHEEDYLFVTDFDRHIRYMEGFHRRWMGSNEAKRDWCERASRMPIDMLCPQHGAIFQGADVERFIHWLDELKVGSGIRG
ncbi:MBL fold metallo-hydrolase [Thiofaba sp. EF100]|uniref:MBL fold metallo-hydrolase n=1 Tax=Thiofaba sp. EF100 TaxID=3121274 RepID=UPI003221C2A4